MFEVRHCLSVKLTVSNHSPALLLLFSFQSFSRGNLPVQTSSRQHDMICIAMALYKEDPSLFTFTGLSKSFKKYIWFWFLCWTKHLSWYSMPHLHVPQDNNGRLWKWVNAWSFCWPSTSWWFSFSSKSWELPGCNVTSFNWLKALSFLWHK